MKIYFTLVALIFLNIQSNAQQGEWVWVHGSSTFNSLGSFGTQGVSSPTNEPPAFYEACEWTDLNGNFWLFGGLPSGFTAYGDLWKFDPLTNEWTWMKGSGVPGNTGNYGVQGVSSPANQPPAREHGVITWTDLSNNLWMYGGNSVLGDLSDLWKYNISTNEWTWMKGPSTSYDPGSYGIKGVPSPSNNPSSREEAGTAWTDNFGDLWFFGGWNGSGSLNDLWRYNIANNEWTWMRGSTIISDPGNYGSYQIEDPLSEPASRCGYTHWKDNSGNLWFFGGEDFYVSDFNDMWRFNPSTNNWAWMQGSSTPGAPPSYSTTCNTDVLNNPGTRYENRMVWTDIAGNFWTFGGNAGSAVTNYTNDLWMYCTATNLWTWISGDNIPNPPGNWGTLGVSSPLNKPDGRMGCVGWRANTGELYLFGGTVSPFGSFHNDLWKYTIDPACGTCSSMPLALFNAPNYICPGTCVDFTNSSFNATSFVWNFPGGNPSVSTDLNPTNICYTNPGAYNVTLIATNATGSDTLTLNNYIHVYPTPPAQGILQNGDTLFANPGAVLYQWYFNGNIINGATDYFYVAPQSGNYSVVATDENGCEVEAVINNVIASSQLVTGNSQLVIFPNPVNDILEIRNLNLVSKVSIALYNTLGEIVPLPTATSIAIGTQLQTCSIHVSQLTPGMYWLEITQGTSIIRKKIIKD
jgi:hypothetical protein